MRLVLAVLALVSVTRANVPQGIAGDHHDVRCISSSCPFVNSRTGFECMGIPMYDGICVAGQKYKCSNGHRWIERD